MGKTYTITVTADSIEELIEIIQPKQLDVGGAVVHVEEAPAPVAKKRKAKAEEVVTAEPALVAPIAVDVEVPMVVEYDAAELKKRLLTYAHEKGFDAAVALVGKVQAGAEKFRDLKPESYAALQAALS